MGGSQAPPLSSVAGPASSTGRVAASQTDLAEAATAFEGYLVGAMLRIGTRPIGGEESPFDGGAGGRMYRELFFEEMARVAAEGPGFGIGTLLEADTRPASTDAEPGDTQAAPNAVPREGDPR